jgi:hypothetical protein
MVNMAARNATVVRPPPEGRTAAAPLTAGQITSSHRTPNARRRRRRRPPSSPYSFSSCSDFRPKKVTHFFLSAWEEVCWYGNTGGFGLICGSVPSNKNHHFTHAPPLRTKEESSFIWLLVIVVVVWRGCRAKPSRAQERTDE